VHVTARDHGIGRLGQLDDAALLELTRLVAGVLDRYERLWGFALPYMLAVQEAPTGADGRPEADWHLHVELLPPHRSAEWLKVRASVETALGTFINDTVPERTAAELRAVLPVERSWAEVTVPTIEAV
jgi:UDPglucose--hexose-1-phosphate uridylyltransferase